MAILRSAREYPSSRGHLCCDATGMQNTVNRWSHRQDATSGLAFTVYHLNHPGFAFVLTQQNMLPLQRKYLAYLRRVLLIAVVASSVVAMGQQSQQQQLDALDKYAKEAAARGEQSSSDDVQNVVKVAYTSDQLLWDSGSDKLTHRGGDEVAVALVHVIGPSPVTDLGIERICYLLNEAFRFPDLIEKPRDRHPDVSLLLLESGKLRTNNPELQGRVSALRSQLLSLYQAKE
jgi:hypothetical protein